MRDMVKQVNQIYESIHLHLLYTALVPKDHQATNSKLQTLSNSVHPGSQQRVSGVLRGALLPIAGFLLGGR